MSTDEDAFRGLVDAHRRSLHAHCYRMLGSPHDADDALQETLLRAWRGLAGFRAGAPARPWLFKIATNVCLDEIASRPRRVVMLGDHPPSAPTDGPGVPLAESVWLEPYPDEPSATYEQRESVELAFVAALQHLPARQRAVLLLREVLGFSAREVATSLETTEASVNSAMQRARSAISDRAPAQSQQATMRSLGDGRVRELVERYVAAWDRHDVEALRALLVEDAIFAMPPYPEWWQGRDAIVEMFGRVPELACGTSSSGPTVSPRSPGTCGRRTARPTSRRRSRSSRCGARRSSRSRRSCCPDCFRASVSRKPPMSFRSAAGRST